MGKYAADVLVILMAQMEGYGDAFERMAHTREEKQLVAGFKQLESVPKGRIFLK